MTDGRVSQPKGRDARDAGRQAGRVERQTDTRKRGLGDTADRQGRRRTGRGRSCPYGGKAKGKCDY